MSEHECIIGMYYYDYEDIRLATVNELLKEIQDRYKLYEHLCKLYDECDLDKLETPYTLKDYCDRRRSTDLIRFEFCPYCGKKIDWKKIKEENKDEESKHNGF